ncbi:MAG: hypothetical protein MUQ27_09680 [Acidimicrobiia bacterium]|nr:hypothetical protein [Acidimicrobiia bacterium]
MSPSNEAERRPPPIQIAIGWIVAALLIFLAQRDLRRRPPEAVRGPVAMWRLVAGIPPGAVAYLILGRRRMSSPDADEPIPA